MSRVSSAGRRTASVTPQFQLSALASLACALDSRQPVISPRERRASVAVILRVHQHKQHDEEREVSHVSPVRTNPVSARSSKRLSTTEEFESSDADAVGGAPRSSRRLVKVLTAINRLGTHAGFHESDAELQILYMLRASNPRDRWSGQVAYPGGRSAPGETDEQAAVREVFEEIGFNLHDSSSFLPLGRLDDFHIDPLAPGLKQLAVSIFLYLQLRDRPFKLDKREVRAVIWTPFSFFITTPLPWSSLRFPVHRVTSSDRERRREVKHQPGAVKVNATAALTPNAPSDRAGLSEFVDNTSATFKAMLPISFFPFSIHFPALILPGEFTTSSGRTGNSEPCRVQVEAQDKNGQVRIAAQNGARDALEGEFVLWGFTLRVTAQLLLTMGYPELSAFLRVSDRSSRMLQVIVNMASTVQTFSALGNLGSFKYRRHAQDNQADSKL